MDFGLRGFVLWESGSSAITALSCGGASIEVLWDQKFKWELQSLLRHTWFGLSLFSICSHVRQSLFWYCLFGCERDQKYFWKHSEEGWQWNLGLMLHLLSTLFDWTLICIRCFMLSRLFFKPQGDNEVIFKWESKSQNHLQLSCLQGPNCYEALEIVGIKAVDGP